jgi:hypothetical protein
VVHVSCWRRDKLVIGYGCAWPCGDVYSTALRVGNVQVYRSAEMLGRRVSDMAREIHRTCAFDIREMEYMMDTCRYSVKRGRRTSQQKQESRVGCASVSTSLLVASPYKTTSIPKDVASICCEAGPLTPIRWRRPCDTLEEDVGERREVAC